MTAAVSVWLFWILLAAAGVALCGFYAGIETGIYVLNKTRLELRAETGSRPAQVLRRMFANSRNLLAVLLIGTNLASYMTTFAVSAMLLLAGHSHLSVEAYTMAITAPMLFVFGESVPKNAFQRQAETVVYRLVWPLKISNVVFNAIGLAPLLRGFSAVLMRLAGADRYTRTPLGHEGLAVMVAEGQATGLLTHFQTIMADRVLRISEVLLQHVMIPMRHVVTAPLNVAGEQLTDLLRNHSYSRVPVVDANNTIVGILNIYDALIAGDDLPPKERMKPALVLPAATKVTEALYQMQRRHSVMAIVADGAGRHIGMVTIKDLVEEIVGELEAW